MTERERIAIIQEAIDSLQPIFDRDGGDMTLVGVEGDIIRVRMSGACAGCELSSLTLLGLRQRLVGKLGRAIRVVPVSAPVPVSMAAAAAVV